ncbi:MAG: winged helix-turn-helix transcriptional regulator [Acidimicrobiales bacterium]
MDATADPPARARGSEAARRHRPSTESKVAAHGSSGTRALFAVKLMAWYQPHSMVRSSSCRSPKRPLMAALDLLGRRWALRLLWELRDGPLGARSLKSKCDDMSSSVLYQRLAELTEAGLVRHADAGGYELTALGRALGQAIEPLDRWAEPWARR